MVRTQQRGQNLASELAGLSSTLQACPDVSDTGAEIVAAAVRLVPGADHAAVSLRQRAGMRTAAATSGATRRTDTLQYWCRQGPSVQAMESGAAVRADSLRQESRWPEFTPRAIHGELGSLLALPLTQNGFEGALLLCAPAESAFTQADEHTAALVAVHAAVALAAATERGHLRTALESRDVIGQATGVLMERRKLSAQEAFAALARQSQNTNRKLREVAKRLVRSGEASPAPAQGDSGRSGVTAPPS